MHVSRFVLPPEHRILHAPQAVVVVEMWDTVFVCVCRFAGAGRRCCPLCRTPDYQTRRTRQAAIAYIQHCASMLQAVYRGHITRIKYFEMRKQLYIACGGGEVGSHAGGITIDSGRKRVFQAQLLGDLHRRLRVAAAATSARIVDLFEETDRWV